MASEQLHPLWQDFSCGKSGGDTIYQSPGVSMKHREVSRYIKGIDTDGDCFGSASELLLTWISCLRVSLFTENPADNLTADTSVTGFIALVREGSANRRSKFIHHPARNISIAVSSGGRQIPHRY
jgi:hypothetical protein